MSIRYTLADKHHACFEGCKVSWWNPSYTTGEGMELSTWPDYRPYSCFQYQLLIKSENANHTTQLEFVDENAGWSYSYGYVLQLILGIRDRLYFAIVVNAFGGIQSIVSY